MKKLISTLLLCATIITTPALIHGGSHKTLYMNRKSFIPLLMCATIITTRALVQGESHEPSIINMLIVSCISDFDKYCEKKYRENNSLTYFTREDLEIKLEEELKHRGDDSFCAYHKVDTTAMKKSREEPLIGPYFAESYKRIYEERQLERKRREYKYYK